MLECKAYRVNPTHSFSQSVSPRRTREREVQLRTSVDYEYNEEEGRLNRKRVSHLGLVEFFGKLYCEMGATNFKGHEFKEFLQQRKIQILRESFYAQQ